MFYTWLPVAYAVLLCAAMWLNRADWRSFLLVAAVGAAIIIPVPWCKPVSWCLPGETWCKASRLWYWHCLVNELAVTACAAFVRVRATAAIIGLSFILCSFHLSGVLVGPAQGIGPYRLMIPYIETLELLCCLVFSGPIWARITRRET